LDSFESLILRARAEHDCSDGASSAELAAAEQRLGYSLPEDLKRILRAANGIRFWANADYPCRLLSTTELEPARVLLQRDEGPPAIIAFIEVQADFVGIDLDPRSESFSRVIDCSHETFPYELFGICDSLEAALSLIVESAGEEWLWPAVLAYDVDFAE
jgi:hypothetical protein